MNPTRSPTVRSATVAKDIIARHWRGELSIWRVIFYCPLLLLIPTGLTILAVSAARPFSASTGFMVFSWSFSAWFWLNHAIICWWLVGLVKTANRWLSHQRLIRPVLLYALASVLIWGWIFRLIPASNDFRTEISEIVAVRFEIARRSEKYFEPWNVEFRSNPPRLVASGSIGDNSAKALANAILKNPKVRLLELNSTGGLVHERDMIVEIVLEQKLDTLVHEFCASSCADIFLAGERRFIGDEAVFAFHQAGGGGEKKRSDSHWDVTEYMSSILYRQRNVKEAFVLKALNTPNNDSWHPTIYDIKDSGYATDSWEKRPAEYR